MKLQLKPGDYVSTKGMTEDQYHAVCKRFIECGCGVGEYPDETILYHQFLGWANIAAYAKYNGNIFHGLNTAFDGKLYTVFEILFCDQPEIWNGTGLPPANTECEYYRKSSNEWIASTVKYIGKKVIVIQYKTGCEFSRRKTEVKFRPIKSDREKAIEEMGKYLQLQEVDCYKTWCAALYDAGYRKQESEK